MQGCVYELKRTALNFLKVALLNVIFVPSKSDKFAYITGFNRVVFQKCIIIYACHEAACCAWQKGSGVCSFKKILKNGAFGCIY